MMYEISLRLELSYPADLSIGDYLRAAGVPVDEAVPCLVGDVAVSVGDSASACIVHWNEETTKEVV
jgi:hypothetical protein